MNSDQTRSALPALGSFQPGEAPCFDRSTLGDAIARLREPLHIVREADNGRVGVAFGGQPAAGSGHPSALIWLGTLPPIYPEWLGDRGFNEVHGTRFAYKAGAMANGIASTRIVIEMARAGMLGTFGSAGLLPKRIEAAIDEVQGAVGDLPYAFNLIHSPQEPALEQAVVDLYLRRGVNRVSASAYMGLTAPLVKYSATGLKRLPDGRISRRTFIFAKISRPETARRFLMPASPEILGALLASGQLTAEEAELAKFVPVAEDISVEADSGGHTDNRPLVAMFPVIAQLRDQICREQNYSREVRVGAGGGLGTPRSVAAAFSMGAAYVLTGSVNQAAIESDLSTLGKEMLAKAGIADVVMAPAADMFEMGVKVQVLKRGTLFSQRGHKLYEIYNQYESFEALPKVEREKLEKEIFGDSLENIWEGTRQFFAERDPRQLERAAKDPKHKMALVFRWYLGKSSRWAIAGDPARVMDYQIWCGPSQGAFNEWVKGSFLEPAANRTVVQIARNLLEGAAVATRAQQLRTFGVAVPDSAYEFRPRPLA